MSLKMIKISGPPRVKVKVEGRPLYIPPKYMQSWLSMGIFFFLGWMFYEAESFDGDLSTTFFDREQIDRL